MISKVDIGLESLLILISDLKCQIVNLPGWTLKCAWPLALANMQHGL